MSARQVKATGKILFMKVKIPAVFVVAIADTLLKTQS
jgi:hypothetical protein